eukprot:TRINITY_DN49764_c0_g1_i1.p1 TRINITY_DN49764_c0_g1~~TRINITY_DN49764_c0_g1_i1.p1  ORF type:complete len:214 (-),score=21.31 TRINITY_DN49764_c0_g1_i1:52-693(-)
MATRANSSSPTADNALAAAQRPQSQDAPWRVPYWQPPIREEEIALADDGPLSNTKKAGYLQKRAGKSRFRWNIRYFEVREGTLKWWRPAFKEQVMQPAVPKVAKAEPRPKAIRSLDLTKIHSVTRTRVKFPYSTRILVRWKPEYTEYVLELRSEREIEILEWFKLFSRFTYEQYEAVEDGESTDCGTDVVGDGDSDSDAEFREESATPGPSDA